MPIERVGDYTIKKSKFWGDRIIYPIKNDDGTTNWFNLITGGAWGKAISSMLVFLMVLAIVFSYKHDVSTYQTIATQCIENPCHWCQVITQSEQTNKNYLGNYSINLSAVDLRPSA